MLNSLSFCLSVKLLLSLSNLNEILAGQSNLGCRFFPFITLNISCHSLLDCRTSAEKSAVNLIGVPLYVICHFSLVAFNNFSLPLIFVNLITMCLSDVSFCVSPWVYPAWYSLHFLDLGDYFLSHVREFFDYNLLKYFLGSFLSLLLGPL